MVALNDQLGELGPKVYIVQPSSTDDVSPRLSLQLTTTPTVAAFHFHSGHVVKGAAGAPARSTTTVGSGRRALRSHTAWPNVAAAASDPRSLRHPPSPPQDLG